MAKQLTVKKKALPQAKTRKVKVNKQIKAKQSPMKQATTIADRLSDIKMPTTNMSIEPIKMPTANLSGAADQAKTIEAARAIQDARGTDIYDPRIGGYGKSLGKTAQGKWKETGEEAVSRISEERKKRLRIKSKSKKEVK